MLTEYMNISEHFSCFLYKNNYLTRANVLKSQNADYKMMTMIIIVIAVKYYYFGIKKSNKTTDSHFLIPIGWPKD